MCLLMPPSWQEFPRLSHFYLLNLTGPLRLLAFTVSLIHDVIKSYFQDVVGQETMAIA